MRSGLNDEWSGYYDRQEGREPRPLLLDALASFDGPGEAVDLGSGSGIDTLAMLERGWTVLAIDAQEEAIARVRARVPAELTPGLRTLVSRMEDVELRPVDLVWASFSLFFSAPERFADVWRQVTSAIRPGGRFAGELLGDRDTWAQYDDITSFAIDDARDLLDGFEIERFDEEEKEDEPGPKHWHVFHVIARRR